MNHEMPACPWEQGDWRGLACAWKQRLDNRYQIEVHWKDPEVSVLRLNGLSSVTGTLLIWEYEERFGNYTLIHREDTQMVEGARFGPDIADVERWQARAIEVVDHPEKRTI